MTPEQTEQERAEFEAWAKSAFIHIHLKQLKEAQELYDEAERSAMIAIIILDNALRHKAAAAAHDRSARRLLICTIAANILFFGLWLGIIIGG